MATLEELIARRDKLEKTRAKGVKTVRFGRDEVTYKSDSEMAVALADLNRQIAASQGRTVRRVRIISNKGA